MKQTKNKIINTCEHISRFTRPDILSFIYYIKVEVKLLSKS